MRGLLKGDFKSLERGLGTADDEGDWNAALESADFLLGLPKGTSAKQYGPYSPEKVLAFQKGETGGAFTLTPGSKRFDAKGGVIGEVPASQGAQGGFTLSPGQTRYGPDGQPIASRPDRPAAPRAAGSGVSALPAEYANALDRAILNLPAVRRPAILGLAERLTKAGDTDQLKQVIRQAAVETENVDAQKQIEGRFNAAAAVRDIREGLHELKAAGVDTNIVRGSLEDVARRFGTSTNPQIAALGTAGSSGSRFASDFVK